MTSKIDKILYGIGFQDNALLKTRNLLEEEFTFPPFSVWNVRNGFWQARKRRWIKLGIQSELGRRCSNDIRAPADSINSPRVRRCMTSGSSWPNSDKYKARDEYVSIFDPVICELCYS